MVLAYTNHAERLWYNFCITRPNRFCFNSPSNMNLLSIGIRPALVHSIIFHSLSIIVQTCPYEQTSQEKEFGLWFKTQSYIANLLNITIKQGGIWRGDGGTCPGHWTSGSPSLELIRFSSHDCSCPLAPRKSFDILALYKSDYYYYYYYLNVPGWDTFDPSH